MTGSDVVEDRLRLAGREVVLSRPRRPEDLIDEHAFADDEFLPYWAELWPSGVALAGVVGAREVTRRRVLELGCGLGLPSLAAAVAGADVLATDWSAEAVELLGANAERNGIALTARRWRWTEDPAPLGGPFDLVLAADVLYERRNLPWVLEALVALVAPDGEAWLADPGRATAEPFAAAARERFTLDELGHDGPASVTVLRLRPRAA